MTVSNILLPVSVLVACIVVLAHGGNEIWLPLIASAMAGAKIIAGVGGMGVEND